MSTERYDWAAMRADIESGRVRSFADLSAKYGATEQAIRNRRKADEKAGNPWPLPQIARAQTDNVIDFSQRRAHEKHAKAGAGQSYPKSSAHDGNKPSESEDEPLDAEALDRETQMAEGQMLAVMSQRMVRRAIRRQMRGLILPGMHQSEADVVGTLATAAKNVGLFNRETAGKGKGEPNIDTTGSEEPAEVVIRSERILPADGAAVVKQQREAS